MKRTTLLVASFFAFLWGGSLSLSSVLAAQNGESIYKDYCAVCHGESGKGDGPAGVGLNPKPKDFTDCKAMAAVPDETAFKAIKDGGQSVGISPTMPSWGASLQDEQIRDVVTYIRGFCKK